MSISWYLNRLRSFGFSEVFFRCRQRIRTHALDKIAFVQNKKKARFPFPSSHLILSEKHRTYPIFGSSIDIYKPIDWHKDISSGKFFPQRFAHAINIRSDEYGSAKYAWEVNRLLFLTQIAWEYRNSQDKDLLDLFCYQVASWIAGNPYLMGVNWYSNIEVNIRLINWYYCWELLNADELCKESPEFKNFALNIWMPCILKHCEYSYAHPSRCSSANNHLISEYAGLFVACCRWDFPQKNKWLHYAQRGLEREILLQNTEEGVNREEAAEYIQFINDFFLIAAIIGKNCGHPFSLNYETRLHQMALYLNQMLDQNGNYPMYGDGDDGYCLRLSGGGYFNNFISQLSAFAAYFNDSAIKRKISVWDEKCELLLGTPGREIFENLPSTGDPESSFFCKNSGHFIFRKESLQKEIYLHFDAAPLGYLSIAAHGHSDALSFILHVDGKPVLVDSGTYTYHTQPEWRKYFVGTLAHNTIRINGQNQAQLAGPTLWLKHYQCKILNVDSAQNKIAASHNGYEKLGVTHIRTIEFNSAGNEFVITDELDGKNYYMAEIPFHIHPKVSVEQQGNVFCLNMPGMRNVIFEPDSKLSYQVVYGQNSPILGWYSEHFGEKEPLNTLYSKESCCGSVKFVSKIKVADD